MDENPANLLFRLKISCAHAEPSAVGSCSDLPPPPPRPRPTAAHHGSRGERTNWNQHWGTELILVFCLSFYDVCF